MTSFLLNVPIFSGLSLEDFQLIPILLKPFSVTKGTVIYTQGSPGDGMYLLKSGVVDLSVINFCGDYVLIKTIYSEETFGELSLFDDIPRMTQAIVQEDASGYFLPTEQFRNLTLLSSRTMMLSLQRGFTEMFRSTLNNLCRHIAGSTAGCKITRKIVPTHTKAQYAAEKILDTRLMKKLDCFRYYTPIEIDALLHQMHKWEFPRHYHIFDDKHPSNSCYFIVRGAVRLLNRNKDQLRQLAVFGPGMMLRQHASKEEPLICETAEKCLILEMPSHDFITLFHDESILSWKLIRNYNESLVKLLRTLFKEYF